MKTALNLLLIDNYDSFTYNLYDYFLQLKANCTVIRNDAFSIEELDSLSFDAIVLSPGPERPDSAGLMMEVVDNYFETVPILGICLGHQALGSYFGAELIKAPIPVHGKTSIIKHNGHLLFKNLPEEVEVMRYHSLILKSLDNTPLSVIASTDDLIMAFTHDELPITGIQFHPESILTKQGLSMLKNWLESIG